MLSLFLASFVTFFVAIDPVAMAPMFTTMTAAHDARMARARWRSNRVAIATGILLAFAFGGAWLLEQIHVSIDAFRIAGGMLLFLIAVDMLFEKRTERREERAEKVAAEQAQHPGHQDDISVFPLAIPLICGPGAIASIMLFFAEHEDIAERGIILARRRRESGALPDRVPGGGTAVQDHGRDRRLDAHPHLRHSAGRTGRAIRGRRHPQRVRHRGLAISHRSIANPRLHGALDC